MPGTEQAVKKLPVIWLITSRHRRSSSWQVAKTINVNPECKEISLPQYNHRQDKWFSSTFPQPLDWVCTLPVLGTIGTSVSSAVNLVSFMVTEEKKHASVNINLTMKWDPRSNQRKFRIHWLPPLSYCTSLTGGHPVSAGMNTYNHWVHMPLPVYISEQLVAGKFFILCWTCKLCLLLTVFIRAINEWAGNAWAGWAPELELRVEIQALPLSSGVTLGDLSYVSNVQP